MPTHPPTVCFFTLSAGDWGGASRVLFTNISLLDRERVTPLLLLPSEGPICGHLEAAGVPYLIWGPLTEPSNWLSYLRAVGRATMLFANKKVRAIHVNASFWRPAEILAARLLRIPVIAHYHLVNESPGPWVKHCRAIVCVSRFVAERSKPDRVPKPVIYNPVNLARFDAGRSRRREWGIPADRVVVAFLGQIRDIKGVGDFIAMAHRIRDEQALFVLAGECRDPKRFPGSLSPYELERMIGADGRIRYLGYVKEVESVYHSADIVVVPSRWEEPLGLISLEAFACNRPVVATRSGGIPEVVRHGENGFLVDIGDTDAMAQHVQHLIADATLRRRLGAAGRKMVEAQFTQAASAKFEALMIDAIRGSR